MENGGVNTLNIDDALELAYSVGLNLVEMQHADIPVCKIMDYKKMLYEEKRNARANRQERVETKEVRMGPGIASHDMEIKGKTVNRILKEGDIVKIVMRHKGREMQFIWNNVDKLKSILQFIDTEYRLDYGPKVVGNQIMMQLTPEKQGKA